MTLIILTIIIAGIFGGFVNYCQLYSKENKGWGLFSRCIVIGLGASFLVPLFLQMISNNLVETSETSNRDLLVFMGFCLIAAIFSKRFIETIGDRILKQVKEAKETAMTAKEIAETSKEEVDLLTSKSTEVDESEIISAHAESTTTTTTSQEENRFTKSLSMEDGIKVLKALKDPLYTFRTIKGIVKDSGVREAEAKALIGIMIKRSWVKEIIKDEKSLYALTELGNKIRVIKED